MVNLEKVIATMGILCFLYVGFMSPDWKVKFLAVLYSVGNAVIFVL